MTKKKETLYSNKNNVNINKLLDNPDINLKGGGKQTTKLKKNNQYSDDNNSHSSQQSTHSGGADDDNKDEEDNEDDEDEIELEVDDTNIDEEIEEEIEEENDEDTDIDSVEDDENDEDNLKKKKRKTKKNIEDDKLDDNEEVIKKDCYSKYALLDTDDIDLEELFMNDDFKLNKIERLSKPILFKYEKVRILSTRAKQLANGAKPLIKNTEGLSSKEIALLELKNKLIPLIIQRPIPNSGFERWKLSELEISDN